MKVIQCFWGTQEEQQGQGRWLQGGTRGAASAGPARAGPLRNIPQPVSAGCVTVLPTVQTPVHSLAHSPFLKDPGMDPGKWVETEEARST